MGNISLFSQWTGNVTLSQLAFCEYDLIFYTKKKKSFKWLEFYRSKPW